MDDKEHTYHDFYRGEFTVLSRWFWGTVVAAVAAFLYFAPSIAWAAVPNVKNPGECRVLSDMVWAARALDEYGVPRDKSLAVLIAFYKTTPIEDRLEAYAAAALRFAERNKNVVPHDLGNAFFQFCDAEKGEVSRIFGTGA